MDEGRVQCDFVFSDVLYRPFLCAHTPLGPYISGIPTQNRIPRLENLSKQEFNDQWNDKPFILTDVVPTWHAHDAWTVDSLRRDFGDIKFRAEAVDWTLSTYLDYMRNNDDESPVYLFDKGFHEKMNLLPGKSHSFEVPECFGEDLFTVLADHRPDHRWLIIGPPRSGSTYHKDPNQTSAWNAVIRGSKYWIMFPSHIIPPGVFISEDQSEVTSPLSIAEWLLGFHAEARNTAGCMEGVCKSGELLHVPAGYWHLVVNLEESIAITQNFVPRAHLSGVLSFLKDKHDQVSGFPKDVTDPYSLFVNGMQSKYPDLIQQALDEAEKCPPAKRRKWENAVQTKDEGAFSFGFGDESDAEVP